MINGNIECTVIFENIFAVLENSKHEDSAEIEGKNENDENEEPEKILIIDPDSEVCFRY